MPAELSGWAAVAIAWVVAFVSERAATLVPTGECHCNCTCEISHQCLETSWWWEGTKIFFGVLIGGILVSGHLLRAGLGLLQALRERLVTPSSLASVAPSTPSTASIEGGAGVPDQRDLARQQLELLRQKRQLRG